MAETIGVDLGRDEDARRGLDSERRIVYSSSAASLGLGQDELLETLERELAARRWRRVPRPRRPGWDSRARSIASAASRSSRSTCEIADVPIRELMTERLGLPVFVDNDANVAMLAEHRFGAARGARNAVDADDRHRDRRRLDPRRELYRGSTGAGAELGHIVIEADGPPCQGNCPNRGCVEALASGTAIAREGLAAAERAPDSALGRALAGGEVWTAALVTDAALAGDETAREVVALVGTADRRCALEPRQHLRPGRDRDRRRRDQGGRAPGRAGARRSSPSRALPPMNGTPRRRRGAGARRRDDRRGDDGALLELEAS